MKVVLIVRSFGRLRYGVPTESISASSLENFRLSRT